LREILDLEEVGHNLELPAQIPKMSAFLEARDLEGSELIKWNSRHVDESL
jgi:hypothetical protein